MKRRRTLITSPLEWQLSAAPVPPPVVPVLAERGGTQLKTPLRVVLIDTCEQTPFDFQCFQGWFAGIEKRALTLGDYSIAGMEHLCVVERKDLSDPVHSCTTDRAIFVGRLQRMASYPHRLLVITSPLSQVKSRYPHSGVHPNRITQSLVAILAKCICTIGWNPTVTAEPLPTMISDRELLERNPKTLAAASVFSLANEVFAEYSQARRKPRLLLSRFRSRER